MALSLVFAISMLALMTFFPKNSVYLELTGSLDLLPNLDGEGVLIKRSAFFELATAFFGLAKPTSAGICINTTIIANLFIISISLSC